MGINNVADILRTHAAERADRVALVLDDRAGHVGRAVRAGEPRRRRAAGGRRRPAATASPSSTRTASSTSRCSSAPRCSTPSASTSTGGSPRRRSSSSSTTPRPRYSSSGSDFVPVIDAIADALTRRDDPRHRRPRQVPRLRGVGRRARRPPTRRSRAARTTSPFQLYSSGTTGRPKGVMLSNDNFFALLPVAMEMWEFKPDSVNLVAMPLFHIGGGGWAVAGMYVGAKSVIMRDLDPSALIRLIPEHGITHAFVVPAVLQFMLMVPGAADADYSTLARRRLRGVADQRGRARPQRRAARLQVLAGLRPHRDDGGDRQPAAGGPRPARTSTASVRAAFPAPASSCASSTRTPAPTSRPARSARSGCAAGRSCWATGTTRRRRVRRSTTTAGSSRATPATSTTTATSTSTTG